MPARRQDATFNRRSMSSLAVIVLLVASCGNPAPTAISVPSASTSPAVASPLALAECDPTGLVACNQQAAFLSIPIVDTGLALTYSSQWALGRRDHPGWSAGSLGLAGWSLDVVQRYDSSNGILIGGDGSWRLAKSVPAGSGQSAVPTYDGATAYLFDAAGRHIQTVDGHLGTPLLTIAYDASGRLSKVDGTVNGQAAHLTVQRSADGSPRALVGTDGAITALTLDADGNLVGVQNPAGATTSIAWAAGGLPTSETDPLGGATRYIYDSAGLLVGSTDADGVARQLSQTTSPTSVEVKVSSAQGRVSTYRSEAVGDGLQRTFIAPDGTTTTETTAPDGSWTLSLPDGTTRTVGAVPSVAWGLAAPVQTPDVETRSDGVVLRTEVRQDLAAVGGLPYELSGSTTTTINGHAWVTGYDPTARTTTIADPVGKKTIETFDTGGRLVAQSVPGNAPVTYTYDAQGRAASQTLGTGVLAQTTRVAYDSATGKITITRPDGKTEILSVDAAGQATTTTTPDGSTVVQASNAAGRPSQVQPAGGLSFTLGTSPAGRPTAFLPPAVGTDASIETASYDSDGNLAAVSGLGTRTMKATYDAAGRLTGWTFDQGSLSAAYDPTSGLPVQDKDADGETTAYAYAGSVADMLTWSGPLAGSVSTTLDANGRTVAETVDTSPPMTLAYDPSGELTAVDKLSMTRDSASGLVTATALGAVQTAEQYDANDQLIRSTTTASGKGILDVQYRRDSLGRITSAVETGADGSTTTTTYAYDGADRLAEVQVNGKTVETDTYDGAGNRTSVTTPTGTTRAVYDARDRMVNWGAATYSWAADGNLAQRSDSTGSTAFTFDDLGRLRGVSQGDSGAQITYVVDADGRRVGRSVNGQLVAGYLYDPAGQVVAETDGTGALTERYGYDDLGHLVLVERGGSTYRVVTDPVGSPLLVIDSGSGTLVDAISYDAWGRITSETAPGTIPFGFAGGLFDPATGLVHFGARDYDPTTGRWTGSDPIQFTGGDPNLYRYSSSDPVNRADPTGLCAADVGDEGLAYGGAGLAYYAGRQAGCAYDEATAPPPPPPPGPSGFGFHCHAVYCWQPPSGTHYTGPNDCLFANCDQYGPKGFSCAGFGCSEEQGGCVFGSCSYGDVHMRTGDREHVDFQGGGEFIAIMALDGGSEVQVRQEPPSNDTRATFTTAVAATVAGDRVGVYAREPPFLVVNGAPIAGTDFAEQLPRGGTVERHGGTVTIGWPNGSRLTIWQVANTLNYGFVPGSGVGPTLRGLLGSADGNPANDLTGGDGVVLSQSDPAFATKLYSQFGNSWRVKPAESLFDYQPGESTATFTKLTIPTSTETAASLPTAIHAMADAVCRAVGVQAEPILDDCILDVGVTGDPAFAAAEAAVAAAGLPAAGAPTSPPAGTGNQHQLVLGQAVSATLSSPTQHDDYTLTATPGEVIYLQAQGACTTGLQWALIPPDTTIKDTGPSCQDLGREVLTAAGIWTVRVSSDGTASGAYAFTAQAVPAVTSSPLTLGQAVTGSIGQIGAWYEYSFNANAGDIVYLQGQGSCTTGLDWALLAPDGTSNIVDLTCHDLGRVVLATSGQWIVRAYSSGTSTGAFTFTVDPVPAPTTGNLVIGQPLTGSIGKIGQWINQTFTATPGEVVDLKGLGPCITGLDWSLIRPDGTTQDFDLTCHTIGREVLATGGTWTIRIYSVTAATGAYSVEVSPGS